MMRTATKKNSDMALPEGIRLYKKTEDKRPEITTITTLNALNKFILSFQYESENDWVYIGFDDWDLFYKDLYLKWDNKTFYEVLRQDMPVLEYYDFDLEGEFTEEQQKNISEDVINGLLTARDKLGMDRIDKKDIIVLTAHKKSKISLHMILPACLKNTTDMGLYFNHVNREFKELFREQNYELDKSVYGKDRNMRMWGSVKWGKNNPLQLLEGYNKPKSLRHSLICDYYGTRQPITPTCLMGSTEQPLQPIAVAVEPSTKMLNITIDIEEELTEWLLDNPYYKRDGHQLRRTKPSECPCAKGERHSSENLYIVQIDNGNVIIKCHDKEHTDFIVLKYSNFYMGQQIVKDYTNHGYVAEKYVEYNKGTLYYTTTHNWVIYDKKDKKWFFNLKDITYIPSKFLRTCVEEYHDKITREYYMLLSTTSKNSADKKVKEQLEQLQEAIKVAKQSITKMGSSPNTKQILEQVKSKGLCMNNDIINQFERNDNLICFKNGIVYDLNIGQSRQVKKEDYIIVDTGYNFPIRDPECVKRAKNIIESCFYPRELTEEELKDELKVKKHEELKKSAPELVKTWLSVASYYLHGGNIYEKFIIWTGSGGNGKGLLDTFLRRVLGGYYTTLDKNQLCNPNNRADSTNSGLVSCQYARLVMTTEPSNGENDTLKTEIIKKWTGRDPVRCRTLYKESFEFIPKFTLTLQANELPNLSNSKDMTAMKRRLFRIPFPLNFVEAHGQDLEVHENIGDERIKIDIENDNQLRDGFLWLLLDTYKETKGKLYTSQEVSKATADYILQNNKVYKWFVRYYEVDLTCAERVETLYENFKNDNTEFYLTQDKFSKELSNLLKQEQYEGVKTKSKGVMVYRLKRKRLNHSAGDIL